MGFVVALGQSFLQSIRSSLSTSLNSLAPYSCITREWTIVSLVAAVLRHNPPHRHEQDLSTCTGLHKTERRGQTFMSWAGFKPTTSVLERSNPSWDRGHSDVYVAVTSPGFGRWPLWHKEACWPLNEGRRSRHQNLTPPVPCLPFSPFQQSSGKWPAPRFQFTYFRDQKRLTQLFLK
jgi:hypothetical protein